jgi:RHS repeat-associated protein
MPTISLWALGFRAGFAIVGKALKFAASQIARQAQRLRQHLFQNMNPGFLKCDVLRAEPVNIITGEVWLEQSDFTLAGRIPIEWIRSYTSNNRRPGANGVGWETPADGRLEFDPVDGSVVFRYPGEGPALFLEKPNAKGDEAAVMELMNGALLSDHGIEWRVRTKSDRIYHFPKTQAHTTDEGLVEAPLGHISDLCGNWLKFLRTKGRLTTILESAGRYFKLDYTETGYIRAVTLHVPGSDTTYTYITCEYNQSGDLTVLRDALGNPYLFDYDEHHMIRHVDRNGLSFHYEFDKSGDEWRAVHTWGDGGLYNYHFDYLPEIRETRITDSLNHVTTIKCSESGLPILEIDPLGGRTLFEYDEAGRTTAVVNPANHRTEYRYDERGNLIEQVRPDGSTITVEIDDNNKPVAITDPIGAVWRQVWDDRGLLQSRTSPLGAVAHYHYDPSGLPVTLTNALENSTNQDFDRYGHLISLTDTQGATTHLQRDEQGNLVAYIDPLDRTTRFRYDEKSRLVEVLPVSGGRIRYRYDGEDNLIAYEDKYGARTGFEYFGQARLTKLHQPNGQTIEYHYNTEEWLIGVTNQRGELYEFRHDALGRVIEEVDYWGQSTQYSLDSSGYLKQRRDPLGRVTDYTTDKLGRVLRKNFDHPDGPGKTFEERFEYDANGNLTGSSNEHAKIKHKYDLEGRVLEERQGGFLIKSEYDKLGQRVRRETGSGQTIIYAYDPSGRPVSIQINDESPITFERDSAGRILNEQLAPSLERHFVYDKADRISSQGIKVKTDWLFHTSYDYDEVGNLVQRDDSHFGIDRYRYDPIGQIIEHIDPQGKLKQFIQDPAGDRLATRVVDIPEQHVVGGANIPGEWFREGYYEGNYYRFDRAGNLTHKQDHKVRKQKSGPIRKTNLGWDANQRLVHTETDGTKTYYGYDPLGRRLFKRTGTRQTCFGWDGNAMVAEWVVELSNQKPLKTPASPTPKADSWDELSFREYLYYPGNFKPLAMIEKGESYRYYTEPNGSPSRMIHIDGSIVWSAKFNVLGQIDIHVNTVDNRLRMQGQYHDKETGLYYNRFRYYDADSSQFVGQDPSGLLGGINNYWYAPNGLGWIDPLGLNHTPARDPNWQSTQTGTTSGNSSILRGNLGLVEGDGLDAHHIVHSTNPRAAQSRAILDEYQIDINEAVNGVALIGGKGAPQNVLPRHHKGSDLHSYKGADAVNDRIVRIDTFIKDNQKDWATGRAAVLEELRLLRSEIVNGIFP